MTTRLCCRLAARIGPVATFAALAVNAIHPVIHGTPLDGGALDALVANLNMFAAYYTALGAAE